MIYVFPSIQSIRRGKRKQFIRRGKTRCKIVRMRMPGSRCVQRERRKKEREREKIRCLDCISFRTTADISHHWGPCDTHWLISEIRCRTNEFFLLTYRYLFGEYWQENKNRHSIYKEAKEFLYLSYAKHRENGMLAFILNDYHSFPWFISVSRERGGRRWDDEWMRMREYADLRGKTERVSYQIWYMQTVRIDVRTVD